MKQGKSIFSKIFLSTMILAILFTSFTLSASAAGLGTPLLGVDEVTSNDQLTKDPEVTPMDVPEPAFWKWVRTVLLVFVSIQIAEAFVSNAINNGIDATCKKWEDNWGIRQACKVFQEK